MTQDEAKTIAHAVSRAIDGALGKCLEQLSQPTIGKPPAMTRVTSANGDQHPGKALGEVVPMIPEKGTLDPQGFEALYQKFKRRLLDECRVDPVLLHLLTKAAPEMVIEIEPRRIELEGSTLKGRIARLAAGGFFKAPKSQADTNRELARTGSLAHTGRLSEAFTALVQDGFLTREDDGFQIAPGATVTEKTIEAR